MQESGCISRNYSSHSQAGSVGVSMAGVGGTTNRSTALQMNETQFCDDILSCILALDEVIAEFDDPLSSLNSLSESSSSGNTVPLDLPPFAEATNNSSENTNLPTPASSRESPKTKPLLDKSQERNNCSVSPAASQSSHPPNLKTAGSTSSPSTPRLIIPIQSWNCRQSSQVSSPSRKEVVASSPSSSVGTAGYGREAFSNCNGDPLDFDNFLVERKSSSQTQSHLPRNSKSSVSVTPSTHSNLSRGDRGDFIRFYPDHPGLRDEPDFGESFPTQTDISVPLKASSGSSSRRQQEGWELGGKLFPEVGDFLQSPPPQRLLSSSSSFKHERKGSKALSKSITLSDTRSRSSGVREAPGVSSGGSFPKVKLKSLNPLVEFRSVKMQNFILPDDLPEEVVKENWLFPTGKNLPRSLARTRKTCIAEQEEEEIEKEFNPRFATETPKLPAESSSTCSSSPTSSTSRLESGQGGSARKKSPFVVNAPLAANPEQILEPGEASSLESRIPVPIAKPRRASRSSSSTATSSNKPMQYVMPEVKARASVEGVTVGVKPAYAPRTPRQFITTASISPENMKIPHSNNSSEGDDGYLSMINRTDDYRGIWPEELIENEIFSEEELKGMGGSEGAETSLLAPSAQNSMDSKFSRDIAASEKTDYFSDDSLESEPVVTGFEQDESGISVSPIPNAPPLAGGISYDLIFDKDQTSPSVLEPVLETQKIRVKVPPKGEKVECPTFVLEKPKSRKPCSFFIPLGNEETESRAEAQTESNKDTNQINQMLETVRSLQAETTSEPRRSSVQVDINLEQRSSSSDADSSPQFKVSTGSQEFAHPRGQAAKSSKLVPTNSNQPRAKKPRQRIETSDHVLQLRNDDERPIIPDSQNLNPPPSETCVVNVNSSTTTMETANEREHESDGGAVVRILRIQSGSEAEPPELPERANENEYFTHEKINPQFSSPSSLSTHPPPPSPPTTPTSRNKIDQFAEELIKEIEHSAFAEAKTALNVTSENNLKPAKTKLSSTSSDNVTKIIINPATQITQSPATESRQEQEQNLIISVLENNQIKMAEQESNPTSPLFINNNPRIPMNQEYDFEIDIGEDGPIQLHPDFETIPLPGEYEDDHEYFNSRSESLNQVQELSDTGAIATDDDVSQLSDGQGIILPVAGSASNMCSDEATLLELPEQSSSFPNAVHELLPGESLGQEGSSSVVGREEGDVLAPLSSPSGTCLLLIDRSQPIPISLKSSPIPKAHHDSSYPSSDLGDVDSGLEAQAEEQDFDDNASDLSQTPPKFVPDPPPALPMSLTRERSEEKLDFTPRNLNDSPWTLRPKTTIPSQMHPSKDLTAEMPWKKAERNSRSSEDLIEAVNREIHPKVSRPRPAASTLPLNTRNPVTQVTDGRSSFRPFRNIFNRLRKTKSRRSTMNVSDDKSSTLASNSHMSGSLISNINEDELLDEVTTSSAMDVNEKPVRSASTRRSKSASDAKKQSIFARLFSRKAK